MDWRIFVFPAVVGLVWFAWKNYLGALNTNEKVKGRITWVFISVVLLFSAGFALRLSGVGEIIDVGYYFTDFSFLFSYLLIAVAALLGQAKYHS